MFLEIYSSSFFLQCYISHSYNGERTVVNTKLYDDEYNSNIIFLSPEDDILSKTNRVWITTKRGFYGFEAKIKPLVPSGAIAASYQLQKMYRLKLYHSYQMCALTSVKPPEGLSDILKTKFEFQTKVGGFDHIFERIFGDVLLTRIYPTSFVAKTCLTKPKGIILHGPPGTGKTLIARTICELLNIKPIIVSGPEIFNHMLGESERKVRDLFENARRDQKLYGLNSNIHIIVFDEIDAVCNRRTSHADGIRSNVEDNVTTQLLTEIDGMFHLDNIFLIGTTNSIDSADPALLRSGRIDTTIEVGLPDHEGRLQIFDIYTKPLLRNGILQGDVDISYIVQNTEGFTGAQIEHVVRLAIHNAMRRDILDKGRIDITYHEAEELQVSNQDFMLALHKVRGTYFSGKNCN